MIIVCSFSGGRSSAVMTKKLYDKYNDDPGVTLYILFANTGCEDKRTLDFVHRCGVHWGWPIVWVEAVVNPQHGVGIRHKVVTYETASRKGEPYEAVVAKYGIFNRTSPACTARLKTEVMESYLKTEKGLKFRNKFGAEHYTAIGIRADELDRVSSKREENKILYPLLDAGVTKRGVAKAMKMWPFDLGLPSDAYGNCVWCWKKTRRKHLTLARDTPEVFDFCARMERLYGHVKGDTAAGRNGRRYWFKNHETTDDIIASSKTTEFTPYSDDPYDHAYDFDPELDVGGGCGESCEVYADE